MRRLYCILLMLVLAGCIESRPKQNELEAELVSQQARFQVVVDSIERYRTTNKVYPESLDQVEGLVATEVSVPSRFKTLRAQPVKYEVARDRSFFRIIYGMYDVDDYELHASSSYLSTEKIWKQERHLDQLVHIERKYYGRLYQRDRSKEYLDLAVRSLLASAKANSAYPCRNFWKDWITESLGQGNSTMGPFPASAVREDVAEYAAMSGDFAYAFAFQNKLYSPMEKPLMIAVAVYRKENGDAQWDLVQQCDSSS